MATVDSSFRRNGIVRFATTLADNKISMPPGDPYVGSASCKSAINLSFTDNGFDGSGCVRLGNTVALMFNANVESIRDPNVKLICPIGFGAWDCPTPLMTMDVGWGFIPRKWTTFRETKLSCDALSNNARNACDFPLNAVMVTRAVARMMSDDIDCAGRDTYELACALVEGIGEFDR